MSIAIALIEPWNKTELNTIHVEKGTCTPLSQACLAKLGIMKRVRDGSISWEEYGGQS